MSYSIYTIPPFDKQIKRLAKKYPSLKTEYTKLIESLEAKPNQGKLLTKSCYKIRLAIASKNKGKSSGARVITYFQVNQNNVFLLSIFDKSEKANISDKEIIELLSFIE